MLDNLVLRSWLIKTFGATSLSSVSRHPNTCTISIKYRRTLCSQDMEVKSSYPPTYLELNDHSGLIYAHVAVMTTAWIILLPVGAFRSR